MKAWLAAVLLLAGCTNDIDSARALRDSGFKDISTDGYAWFACSKDDTYHTKFTATNPAGQRVSGVVCCGLFFKACTVRF